MNYLIQIEDSQYGYNDPRVLLLDIVYIKPSSYKLFRKTETSLKTSYELISTEELRCDSETFEEALKAS